MIHYVLPWAYSNPNDKSIGSAVFAQLTAENPYNLQWAPFAQKCPFPLEDLDPHLIRDSYASPSPQPNGISIDSAVFAQMTGECPYTGYNLQWDSPFSLKIAPSHRGI